MVKQLSPCKDCKDRHMACWDGCEKYKEWKSAFEDNKQKYDTYATTDDRNDRLAFTSGFV